MMTYSTREDETFNQVKEVIIKKDIQKFTAIINNPNFNTTANNNEILRYCFALGTDANKFIEIILKDKSVDPSICNNTCFISACANGNIELIESLIKHRKVKKTIYKNFGKAIIAAIENCQLETLKLLSQYRYFNSSFESIRMPFIKEIKKLILAEDTISTKIISIFSKSIYFDLSILNNALSRSAFQYRKFSDLNALFQDTEVQSTLREENQELYNECIKYSMQDKLKNF
jgi:hypothetical protein